MSVGEGATLFVVVISMSSFSTWFQYFAKMEEEAHSKPYGEEQAANVGGESLHKGEEG